MAREDEHFMTEAEAQHDRIYLSPPDVRLRERELLIAALESGWVAPVGPDLDAFEAEVAARCGVPYAVALSSGTAALHLALLVHGVEPGDDVLVSTLTFVASANAVTYCGATPVFIDSDPATWNISPGLLLEELEERRRSGRLPKAVVVVDLYGQSADYDAFAERCRELGVVIVEDAAEALGATYKGQPCGGLGDIGVLSFNGNKILTTSGGGMLLTRDAGVARRVRHLATQAREPFPHYEHVEVGFNYRLSNLLAAFGRGQLEALDDRIRRRREIFGRYQEAFAGLPGWSFLPVAEFGEPNFWLTCALIDPAVAGYSSRDVLAHLEQHNIEARPTWKPMHLQPVFSGAPHRTDGTAELIFDHGVCLPSGSGMSVAQLERVLVAVVESAAAATPT